METENETFSVIIATVAKNKNASSKKWIIWNRTTTGKRSWLGEHLARKKCHNFKEEHIQKKGSQVSTK